MRRVFFSLFLLAFVLIGFGQPRAYAYTFYTIDYIDGNGNTYDTRLYGINNNGKIVGAYSQYGGLISHGLIYDSDSRSFKTLDYNNNNNWTELRGINDKGNIVGNYRGDDAGGFFYDSDTETFENSNDVSGMPGGYSDPQYYDINNNNVIVGHSRSGSFIYFSDDRFLSKFDGDYHYYGISDNGYIVGAHYEFGSNWMPSCKGLFEDLTGYTREINLGHSTYFYDVNNDGLVVGTYSTLSSSSGMYFWSDHGFIFDSSTNATTLLDYSDANNTRLYGINNKGWIVGTYYKNDKYHGFLAKPDTPGQPVPEPATALLLFTGLGLIPLVRRKRK